MYKIINNVSTNWKDIIDKEFKKDYLLKIQNYLLKTNETIYPDEKDVFRCFNYFNLEDTKMVIFGQDPYHGVGQANGLCFSVNKNVKTPPSLKNIFKKLNDDLKIERTNPDLTSWAEQGVLLLNTSLTVIKDKPASLSKIGWINFIKNIINEINNIQNKVIFILMGNDAKSLEPFIDTSKHIIIKSCHPSPLSVNRYGFFENDLFNKINDLYFEINKKKFIW